MAWTAYLQSLDQIHDETAPKEKENKAKQRTIFEWHGGKDKAEEEC